MTALSLAEARKVEAAQRARMSLAFALSKAAGSDLRKPGALQAKADLDAAVKAAAAARHASDVALVRSYTSLLVAKARALSKVYVSVELLESIDPAAVLAEIQKEEG